MTWTVTGVPLVECCLLMDPCATEVNKKLYQSQKHIYFANRSRPLSKYHSGICSEDMLMTDRAHDVMCTECTQVNICEFLCGISPHFVRTGDISLFVYERQVFVTWSLLGRERTLGMSACAWLPLLLSMMMMMMSLINHKIKNTYPMLHKQELCNEFTIIYCS